MAKKYSTTVSVVITTKNEISDLPTLLKALQEQIYLPDEVVVVDDDSVDGTWQWLLKSKKNFTFPIKSIQKKSTRGLARNIGIKNATSNLIAITDAGCLPQKEWLGELLRTYHKHQKPNTEIVVSGFTEGEAHSDFEEAQVPYMLVMKDQVNLDSYLPATRSMLLSKEVWSKMAGFRNDLNEGEDYEFAKRLTATANVKIVFASKAVVTWRPRKNLQAFYTMVRLIARGDAKARSWRLKVLSIFLRYLVFVSLLFTGFVQPSTWLVLAAILFIYCCWAISKNYRYVPNGWKWLPILQLTSDVAVQVGTVQGLLASR